MSEMERKKKVQGTMKTLISVISIMFMFGLQWLFGAFAISEASLAFQWLFVIFSSLQGFFLFLFFCVLGQDAREEWLNLFSLGFRKKKKRGVITSHVSQTTRRDRNTGSTYITSKHSNTLRKSALSGDSSSTVELTSKKNIYLAMPTSISEERETDFILSNDNTDHDQLSNGAVEVGLANGHSTDLDAAADGTSPPVEVPTHILEGRFMFRYNPAAVSPPLLGREDEEKEDDGEGSHTSEASTTDCYDITTTDYGELTQQTELSVITNSDVSDTEEISHL